MSDRLSQEFAELQTVFGEQIGTLRVAMESKLLTHRVDQSGNAPPPLNDDDASGGNGYEFVISTIFYGISLRDPVKLI